MRDHRRAVAAFTVAAGLAAFARPAAAAPAWNDGLPEDHFTQTCESIGGVGGYREEHSSQVRTGTFVDAQSIPRVGEVFYARVTMAAVGGCGDKSFIPEVVAPLGVEVAISAANPVRCHYTLPDGSDTALGGCPQRLQTGPHGGLSLAPDGNPNNAWTGVGKIPGTPALTRPQVEIVYIEFPLRASRPMRGLPGGPTCTARTLRTGPCNRDAAGDFLQVAVTVYDVSIPVLTPAIGLVVSASGDSTPARGSLVTVAQVDAASQRGERHPAARHGAGGRRTGLGDADGQGPGAHLRRQAQRREGGQSSPAHEAHPPGRSQAAARQRRHRLAARHRQGARAADHRGNEHDPAAALSTPARIAGHRHTPG